MCRRASVNIARDFGLPLGDMILLHLALPVFMSSLTHLIVDFTRDTDLDNWSIQDDVVMGGRSDSDFRLNDEGHFVFSGKVSLENNGGFAQVRYHPAEKVNIGKATHLVMRVKGDGKDYQLRIKEDLDTRHTYIRDVSTSGEWEEMRVALADFHAVYHGKDVDAPNFDFRELAEVGFLIGNKRAETFKLMVDWVGLD